MSQREVILIPHADRGAWESAVAGNLPGLGWGHANGLAAIGMHPELAVVHAGGATMLLPFFRREFRGFTDIASLPGITGAVIQPSVSAPLDLWGDFAKGQGWITSYIQLSPLNDHLPAPAGAHIQSRNALFVFDLDYWTIEGSVSKAMRRNIRTGDRVGAALVTDRARLIAAFPALYAQLMAHHGEAERFADAALAAWLESPSVLAFGAEVAGEIVNIQMGSQSGDWAEIFLAGATNAGRVLQPWVIWQAMAHLRAAGRRWLNFGGVGEIGDGLYQMKTRFGATEHPLRAVCMVHDAEVTRRLAEDVGADPETRYFPPFRSGAGR